MQKRRRIPPTTSNSPFSYSPSNGAKDGKFHKIKVELVAPDGRPAYRAGPKKARNRKFQVYASRGAIKRPKAGVGD